MTEKGKAWKKVTSNKKYDEGWERIFGKKKTKFDAAVDEFLEENSELMDDLAELEEKEKAREKAKGNK